MHDPVEPFDMSCESREDLQAYEREMRELDNTKDQIMTLLKVGLANLGMWVRDHHFGESYQSCGWERLVPFFQLSGWVTTTETEVRLELLPVQPSGNGTGPARAVSKRECQWSPPSRWQALGAHGGATAEWMPQRPTREHGVNPTLVMPFGKKLHPLSMFLHVFL